VSDGQNIVRSPITIHPTTTMKRTNSNSDDNPTKKAAKVVRETKSFEDMLEAATQKTREAHGEMSICMDPELIEVYRRKYDSMEDQSSSSPALKKAMTRAIRESNTFNVVRDLPSLSYMDTEPGRGSVFPNETIEAMVNARVLKSENELTGAQPEAVKKFNMLNRWFGGNKLPEGFSKDTVRTLLKNYKACKFMRLVFGMAKGSISCRVIDNFTDTMNADTMNADIQDTRKLLTSLGFDHFNHLIKWCSKKASQKGKPSKEVKQTRQLAPFKKDAGLIHSVKLRLGISLDEGSKPVINAVRCLIAVIDKHCPQLKAEKDGVSERKIHGEKTQRFFITDEDFINFFFEVVMCGKEPKVPWEARTKPAKQQKASGEAPPPISSNLGTALKYQTYS
jgi:hypothetical protein